MLLGPYLHGHGHTHNKDNNQPKEQMEMKYIKTESGGDKEVEANRNKIEVLGFNFLLDPNQDPELPKGRKSDCESRIEIITPLHS